MDSPCFWGPWPNDLLCLAGSGLHSHSGHVKQSKSGGTVSHKPAKPVACTPGCSHPKSMNWWFAATWTSPARNSNQFMLLGKNTLWDGVWFPWFWLLMAQPHMPAQRKSRRKSPVPTNVGRTTGRTHIFPWLRGLTPERIEGPISLQSDASQKWWKQSYWWQMMV